jgi:hypothetical protein
MTTTTARSTAGRSTSTATGRRAGARAAASKPRKPRKPRRAPTGGRPASPYTLRASGEAWWRWAWKLPQAKKWDAGALYVVARRASLEDDLALLEGDDISVADVLGLDSEPEMARELDWLIARLRSIAGGRVGVMKEMRELDARLGLDPKAMAGFGWSADDDDSDAVDELQKRRERRPARRARSAPKART